jgi:hypothetical protein
LYFQQRANINNSKRHLPNLSRADYKPRAKYNPRPDIDTPVHRYSSTYYGSSGNHTSLYR